MHILKLTFNTSGLKPVYRQLIAALESAIERGEIATGERLPSERGLAEQLKVSRTTVAAAYRELESRGIIRSQVGCGTFVCAAPDSSDAPFAWRGKVSAGAVHLEGEGGLRHLIRSASDSSIISFAAGTPALECFPISDYARLTEKVFKRHANAALGLAPTEGQPRLRAAIAHRFKIKPERILILSGDPAYLTLELVDEAVRVYGDAAVTSGRVLVRNQNTGGEVVAQSRYTNTYTRRQGRWQIVASQWTRIPPQERAAITISPAVLDSYVGQYELAPNLAITITREGNRLMSEAAGRRSELTPETETRFSIPAANLRITFVKNADGQVTHMIVNDNGREGQARRIR